MSKNRIYFRGRMYSDTLYNRLVMNCFTLFYRAKCFIFRFLVFLVFIHLMNSCGSRSAKIETTFYPDTFSLYCDSFGLNGHSYIKFLNYSGDIQVLHNPDCFCRYNRTFVIIKRSK